MFHPNSIAYASWYNMLHEKVDCNAGITLFVEIDPSPDKNGMPLYWLTIDQSNTDPTYFGRLLGNAVYEWWENTIDDSDYPTPMALFEDGMEHYCGTVTDPTHAFRSDWLAEAYNVGIDLVIKRHDDFQRALRDEDHRWMLSHGYEFVGYDYVKAGVGLDRRMMGDIMDDEAIAQEGV